MLYSIRRAALLLLLLPCVNALPDFSCVCEKSNVNACVKTFSCHLNSTIDFTSSTTPSWVTDAEETLFSTTIDRAKNGTLRPPFFTKGRMTWDAVIACNDESGDLQWHYQVTDCPTTSTAAANSTKDTSRRHGWASVGFHPFGTEKGTWLTQILGEIDDAAGAVDSQLSEARCADSGLYVDVRYINASEPYDPRFTPQGRWGVLYADVQVYPVGSAGVPSHRTDNDLIDNGVDLDCTGYDTSGYPCVEPDCSTPANLTHYDCPAGVVGLPVGASNCSRTYREESSSASRAARSKSLLGLVAAGVTVSALALGI